MRSSVPFEVLEELRCHGVTAFLLRSRPDDDTEWTAEALEALLAADDTA
jgi:hypothetical protein